MVNTAIVILAAGASCRFGAAKQLLKYNEESFIQHAVTEALKIADAVAVVLGANEKLIKKEIKNRRVQLVYNKDWEEGMSSSIRCGLSALLKSDALTNSVIFMVCDQPFVTSSLLGSLIAKYEETKSPVIASAYQDTAGTPVLFDKKFFPALLALKGQAGAKKIISQNMGSTITVPFSLGHIDIDTKEDYEALQKNKFNT